MKNHLKKYQFTKTREDKFDRGVMPVSFLDSEVRLHKGQALVVPHIAAFIRDVTEYGNIGAIKMRMLQLSPLKLIKLAWWNKFNILKLLKKDFASGILLLIQIETLQSSSVNPSMYILSDQVTDLAVAVGNNRILSMFHHFIASNIKRDDAFITNNFSSFLTTLAPFKIVPAAIFTTFSTTGYEMNPSRVNCEAWLENIPIDRVVAIVTSTNHKEYNYVAKLGIRKILTRWYG